MATTTIKVSQELRDRINHDARRRGLTAARFLESVLDEVEARQRLDAVRQAYAALPADDDLVAETGQWSAAETDWPS